MKRRAILLVSLLVPALAFGLLAGCAGASKQDTAKAGTETAQAAQTFAWSPDADCTVCHTKEAKSAKDTTMLSAAHASAGAKCVSCHTDAATLKSAHEGLTSGSKASEDLTLSKTVVDLKTCLSSNCHNTTLEELAKKTASSVALTDSKGTVVNPHLAPTLTKAHIDAGMSCANCHTMHGTADPKAYCATCHHQNVFECGTCHTY